MTCLLTIYEAIKNIYGRTLATDHYKKEKEKTR